MIASEMTIEQLRGDIDQGRTHDKVKGNDPAKVPLGADEEAAGFPTPPHMAREAAHYERRELSSRGGDEPLKDTSLDRPFGVLFVSAVIFEAGALVAWLIWAS